MEIKTERNLQAAFTGESQANRRYLFFADKAEKEGYYQIARLFRAAAEAETVHARNHFVAMDGVGSTKDNLTAAVFGEHEEFGRDGLIAAGRELLELPAEDAACRILARVRAFGGDKPLQDDASLLIIKRLKADSYPPSEGLVRVPDGMRR